VDGARQVGIVGSELLLADAQRLARQPLRLLRVTALDANGGQIVGGPGELQAVRPEVLSPNSYGVFEQISGLIVEAERVIHMAHRIHQCSLGRGLIFHPVDGGSALVEQLARGDLAALRLCRIRDLEEPGEELADALGHAHLRIGALPFAFGAEVEDAACGKAGDEREEDHRGGDDRAAVPRHELLNPVAGRRRSGQDWLRREVTLDVVRQLRGRAVAARPIPFRAPSS
jgi:hypothetical protein